MKAFLILALVAFTSVGAYLFGLKRLRLSAQDFGRAISKTLEHVGATLVFCAVNLAVAVTVILAVRGFTGRFMSLYVTGDETWFGLSLLQGLTFQWWRELSGRPR